MRRVVSVWLPTWPTDRQRRSGCLALPDGPVITAAREAGRRVIAGACAVASGLGLRPGMAVAEAQARVPGLHVLEAEPAADAAALRRLAGWTLRFSPLTAADPPDGLWLDITGCAHLHGGEPAVLADLCVRLDQAGIAAQAAIAATPGAAHALARYGRPENKILTPADAAEALALLPIAALRLSPETLTALRRVGLERIGQLLDAPRAPIARRFGADLGLRLDQALGKIFEPITPVLPPTVASHRLTFLEPLLTAEAFTAVIADLTHAVCAALERDGQGARRLDLLFERVDGTWQAIRVGTARPARAPRHLARLLTERLDSVDPGHGVEAMRLVVRLAEPLALRQTGFGEDEAPGIAELVDRLAGRLGEAAVYRAAPVESDLPERAVRRVPPLGVPLDASPGRPTRRPGVAAWPAALPRPARLLDPPQPVSVLALLPDHPPVQFTWRRVCRRVRRADGPERIFGEWWRDDAEMLSVRDYFAVEDQSGRRWWLFRAGDGVELATGDLSWFLHGMG